MEESVKKNKISFFFERASQQKHFALVYSVIINLFIFAAFMLLNKTKFEIADDVIFSQLITDGFYKISFLNYFLCRFIGFIQEIIYPYNAYVIIHLLLAFCGYTAITKIFTEKFNYIVSAAIAVFTVSFFGVNNYLTISFTRLPGLLTVAGFLCIIHYTKRKKWISGTVAGIIFVLIGSAYRFSVFEMSLIIAVAFVFALSVTEFIKDKSDNKKFSQLLKIIFEPKRLISAVLTVAVCFCVNAVSGNINKSTDELLHYSEYTSLRSSVWDYDIPDYEECKSEYDAIGIDANDIEMLRAGYFDEQGALSVEQLQNIHNIQKNYNSSTKSLFSTLKTMIVSEVSSLIHISEETVAVFAFALALIVFILLQDKKRLIVPLILLVADFVCYFYVWYIGRVVFRVLFTIWFASVCCLIYAADYDELKQRLSRLFSKKRNLKAAVSVAVCAVVCACCFVVSYRNNPNCFYYPEYEPAQEINEYINSHEDIKFEMGRETCFSCGMPNTVEDVYHTKRTDYSVNYKTVNCTYYLSPFYNYQLEQFGTDNFYENLLNDNVCFVTSNSTEHHLMMENYLEKYYGNGKEVEMELVKELENYSVYNYSLAE